MSTQLKKADKRRRRLRVKNFWVSALGRGGSKEGRTAVRINGSGEAVDREVRVLL